MTYRHFLFSEVLNYVPTCNRNNEFILREIKMADFESNADNNWAGIRVLKLRRT